MPTLPPFSLRPFRKLSTQPKDEHTRPLTDAHNHQ